MSHEESKFPRSLNIEHSIGNIECQKGRKETRYLDCIINHRHSHLLEFAHVLHGKKQCACQEVHDRGMSQEEAS